jgi:hypothetical protein
VVVLLRPGKTPSGEAVRNHLRRLIRRIRRHWPQTRITIRGDGHCGRPEPMAWCEQNRVDYIFGLPGNTVLTRLVEAAADDVRVRRAEANASLLRRYAEISYRAKSWTRERRVAARIEASTLGLDIRFVVTNIATGSAEWLYDTLYCERGQAENLIKPRSQLAIRPRSQLAIRPRSQLAIRPRSQLAIRPRSQLAIRLHKSQLASDRTTCRAPLANQRRLVLHTAAYWLMLTVRDAIPKPHPLATAEFATLRLRLLKIAARISEAATCVRLVFAAACPPAALVRSIANSLQPAAP